MNAQPAGPVASSMHRSDGHQALTTVRPRAQAGANTVCPAAAFTIDVEDWYQSCIDFDAPITERVVANLDRVLALLDELGVKGTFFVQGRVAETFPRAVETLVTEGHEVQSHGYSHRPLFDMTPRQLRDELERAKQTVEDAAGVRVYAFRAQDFSILSTNLWALDMLAEVGFEIDSSVFPLRMRRYGIGGWDPAPRRLALSNGATILEVPVATVTRGRWRLPVGGGGYFRVLPTDAIAWGLRSIVSGGRPAVIYCHPYEFDARELDGYRSLVSRRTRWSQNLGRASFAARMRALLRALPFGRFDETLAAWGIT